MDTKLVQQETDLAMAFDGMRLDDLYTALAIKLNDQTGMSEEQALSAAGERDTLRALTVAGNNELADFARRVNLQRHGHDRFWRFMKEYGGKFEGRVCGHYRAYLADKNASSKANLIAAVASAIGGFVTAGPWGPVIGILALLCVETGLDVACGVAEGLAPAPEG